MQVFVNKVKFMMPQHSMLSHKAHAGKHATSTLDPRAWHAGGSSSCIRRMQWSCGPDRVKHSSEQTPANPQVRVCDDLY